VTVCLFLILFPKRPFNMLEAYSPRAFWFPANSKRHALSTEFKPLCATGSSTPLLLAAAATLRQAADFSALRKHC
jgi:hypothetical protein